MIASELIKLAYQEAMGESEPPTTGEENYKLLFNAANEFIDTWQDEPGVDWEELQDTLSITLTTDREYTPAVDAKFRRLATGTLDGPYITTPAAQEVELKIAKPSQLGRTGNKVALVSGKVRLATTPSAANGLVGGILSVPYIRWATKLTDGNSTIPVTNPMWLVYMVGWYFASQDYVKSNQAPRLAAMAKNEMESMKAENINDEDDYITHGSLGIPTRTT